MTRRLFRWITYLYPSAFRERYGEEMAELAYHQRNRPVLLVRDLASSLVAAHAEARRRRVRRRILSGTLKDLEVACRGMRRAPGFTAIAIVTIALGVGANTAIFSVVNGVALKPLPYAEPDRLITLWSVYQSNGRRGRMSLPDVHDVAASVQSLESVVGYRSTGVTLSGMGEPEVVHSGLVATGLLETFLVAPHLGRDLRSEENVPGGPRVVMIGHRFWQERFGGRTNVLGETITLGGEPHRIVGVAPAGFDFPDRAQLWLPLYHDVESCGRGCHSLLVAGRLAPEATHDALEAELDLLAAQLADAHPDTNSGKTFGVIGLEETIVGADVRTALYVLLGAVGVVLLIASANVAHLLLARASTRAEEMAVRSALGASWFRLVRQLFIESLVLGALGGLAGILLARWALAALLALAPESLPRLHEVTLDGAVLLFALVAVIGSSVLFGLAPALAISNRALRASRQVDGHTPVPGRSRSLLLAAEVGLSVVLLFGAGLLLRSLSELRAQPLGFDANDVLTFTLHLPDARYPEPEDSVRFFEALEGNLLELPGVEAAGSVYGSPMGPGRMTADISFFDRPAAPPGKEVGAVIRAATPGYADVLGTPIVRGRGIERRDRHDAPRVVVVNEVFAERFYPGKDPLGEQIRLHGGFGYDESEPRTIIGIVGNVRARSVTDPPTPEVWAPQAQMGSTVLTVLVRGRASMPAVREAVRRLDPNLPLRSVATLSAAVERSFGTTRFYSSLLSVFAALAAGLASVGLYGVVSYLVSERRREIGLRMALGAQASDVVRLVLGEGLRPTLLGIALGVAGAVACSQWLHSMLYNVGALDAISLVSSTLGLLAVAIVALLVPARRASSMSPTSTLRID